MLWTEDFKLLQFLSLTSRSPLSRNRSLCLCCSGWPLLPAETQTWGIICSAAHKTHLFILSGFAHLPAHLRSSPPTALCTPHHTPMFYTSSQCSQHLLRSLPPYLGQFLVPTNVPYSAQTPSQPGKCWQPPQLLLLCVGAVWPSGTASCLHRSLPFSSWWIKQNRQRLCCAHPSLGEGISMTALLHQPTWDWNQPKGSYRGALITSISLGNRAKNNSSNSINSAVQNCKELFFWYFDS